MRTCSICEKEKPISEYHRKVNGHVKMCKGCRKERGHGNRKRYRDGHYTVYYLPEHHYVGMTNALKNRMQEHRSKNKRFTSNYQVIGTYKRAVDAHLTETILHSMGYNGFYYKGIKDE
jgi:hypothetical protein